MRGIAPYERPDAPRSRLTPLVEKGLGGTIRRLVGYQALLGTAP